MSTLKSIKGDALNLGRLLAASVALTVMFACAPSDNNMKEAKVHYEMGVLYFQERDFIRALQELVRSREFNASDKHTLNALGLAYRERRLYTEAEEAFQAAIDIDERFSEALNNLGTLYMEQKKYKESIKSFDKAVRNIFYTTPELAYVNRGLAHEKLGDTESAERDYREAITLNPSFRPAYINLAKLMIEAKRYRDAEKVLGRLLSAFDNFAEAHFLMGTLSYSQANSSKAKVHFEKAMKLMPTADMVERTKDYMEKLR